MIQLGSVAAVVGSACSRAIACLPIEVGLRVHAGALQQQWVRLSCNVLYPGYIPAMQGCSGAVHGTPLTRVQRKLPAARWDWGAHALAMV